MPETTTCRVLVPALRLRAGPGTDYAAKGMLDPDAGLAALARNAAASWIEVKTASGQRGWIANASTYVVCAGSVEELPIGRMSPLPRVGAAGIPVATDAPTRVVGGPTSITLLTPVDGTNSRDPITFSWHPNVPLADGQLYELIFWVPTKGQDHEQGGGSWRPSGQPGPVCGARPVAPCAGELSLGRLAGSARRQWRIQAHSIPGRRPVADRAVK